MKTKYMVVASFWISILAACGDGEVPDDEVSIMNQALLPSGGTVRVAIVPYKFTDSDLAEIPTQAELVNLAFTGAGFDGATGSVKGFWNAVSSGRIRVEGVVYPWVPVVTKTAARLDQPEVWRPMDDWYIAPEQRADFHCDDYAWGATPGYSNVTKDLSIDRAYASLHLCPDPDSTDGKHFWGRDGNREYNATSACPDMSTAQRPALSTFYCIHRGLAVIDNVDRGWTLAGANPPSSGIDHNGAQVAAPYNPADWNFDQSITLYGYPTTNAGSANNSRQVYVSLARTNRGYALHNGIHESGHALGLQHASSLSCTDPLGTVVPFDRTPGNCTVPQRNEYGPHNFMGAPSTEHGDGYELLAVGAIAPSNLTTITSSGAYPLPAIASSSKVLRVAVDAARYYYFDHRARIANTFDKDMSADFAGIEVKLAPDYAAEQTRCGTQANCTRALLLDMHPETPNSFGDATLKSGNSYTDRRGRLTIQATLGSSPYVDATFTPNTSKLLFTTIGGGNGYTRRQIDFGLLAIQTIAGFSAWSIIAGTNNSGVVFYNAGTMWKAHLDANANYQSHNAITGTLANVAGWTHISPVGRNNLVFYNATNGKYLIAAMGDSASSFTVKRTGDDWSRGWSVVAGTLNGGVILYNSSTGRLERGTIDGNGDFTRAGSQTIAAGFTKGAAVREDGFALYNDATGAVQVVQLDDARAVTLRGAMTVSTGFTSVAGGIGGHLLFYRASDGRTHIANVDGSYAPFLVGAVTSAGANLLVTSAGGDIIGAVPPPVIPEVPNVHVDLSGCVGNTPQFTIDWSATGTVTVAQFDVDTKPGSGAWVDRYNGLEESLIYNGVAGRTDSVRVRACNALGCSAYRQQSFSAANCNAN